MNGHTTRAQPKLPPTQASLEPGTSEFSTLLFNHYATWGGNPLMYKELQEALSPCEALWSSRAKLTHQAMEGSVTQGTLQIIEKNILKVILKVITLKWSL